MTTAAHFFLGANSGQGFQNLFDRFCAPEDHYDLAVLKGGPGVGKSTLMARLGAAMEARGEEVEYLHCSGDPDSLDGVYIPRIRSAMVDGTAPHVVEPQYPAAADRYLDLGRFYDVAQAKRDRAAVVEFSQACSAAYQRAYRALAAARQLGDSAAALVADSVDQQKLLKRADGIIARELRGRGDGGGDSFRFLGSATCRGEIWRFDSVEALCPRVYQLQDSWGLADPMLQRLRAAAGARGFRAVVCLDPEHPQRIQHLLLPQLGTAFVTSREGMEFPGSAYRRLRLDAMVPAAVAREHKSRLRFIRRMAAALRQEGMDALAEAKASHDRLEAVYRPYVDFSGVDQVAAQEIARFESYL